MEKKALDKVKQREKGRKLVNFYSFQMRETKMERKDRKDLPFSHNFFIAEEEN